jgi:catechol 2,3-dioxygenase-like lactoylglutathione lyase family enzyme
VITKINTVALYVANQQRTVDFYVGKLGFQVCTDAEMGPGARWVEVAPKGADTRFTICDAAHFDRTPGGSSITLTCDDVAATHAGLKAAGVAVTEPQVEAWATFFTVTDPDGHTFVVSAVS